MRILRGFFTFLGYFCLFLKKFLWQKIPALLVILPSQPTISSRPKLIFVFGNTLYVLFNNIINLYVYQL